MKHTLSHADEPEPCPTLDPPRVEPDAVIHDPQGYRIGASRQIHAEVLGAAVLDGISQPFLHEAIEAQRRIGRNHFGHLVVDEFDLETVSLSQLPAEATDGRDEPELLQLCRVQPVRDRKSTRLNSSHGSIAYAVF